MICVPHSDVIVDDTRGDYSGIIESGVFGEEIDTDQNYATAIKRNAFQET